MNIITMLPKDKHDFEAVEKLSKCSKDELRDVLPELMKWLQDGNWPISQPVEDILLRFGDELIPHVRDVFQTRDPQWEYFMLTGLISRLPLECLYMLKPDLERIIDQPTYSEVLEEMDEAIILLLNKIK
ncbi:DUF5071 domain-containing protein [Paenibacillus sp. FSL R7-0652]|jgi:hypothetical protein|uniref:DUF5071 domain-containing protein n=1 Tax=Paenibacillus sp. AN1007 TaxID=3151385 RepID=A0AAU8NDK6_9BACL